MVLESYGFSKALWDPVVSLPKREGPKLRNKRAWSAQTRSFKIQTSEGAETQFGQQGWPSPRSLPYWSYSQRSGRALAPGTANQPLPIQALLSSFTGKGYLILYEDHESHLADRETDRETSAQPPLVEEGVGVSCTRRFSHYNSCPSGSHHRVWGP